ncbi:unnamed protein product [Moneuplotes crassus]|uniref:Uncharacterized protein n=1 Tax=Euplotes crassus TaxID=5936 RepID=A0AAD2D2W5_EUPCR|nr:unnamed protein product [Moneuplotes crassus]
MEAQSWSSLNKCKRNEVTLNNKSAKFTNAIKFIASCKHKNGNLQRHDLKEKCSDMERYIKDLLWNHVSEDDMDDVDQDISVSSIKAKYFDKMLQILSKGNNGIFLRLRGTFSVFRMHKAIRNVIKNVHSLETLNFCKLSLTSKHLMHILLTGTSLTHFTCYDCHITGPKIAINSSRVFPLMIINLHWGNRTNMIPKIITASKLSSQNEESEPTETTTIPSIPINSIPETSILTYFSTILWNICQCPFVKTMVEISIEFPNMPAHISHELKNRYSSAPIDISEPQE